MNSKRHDNLIRAACEDLLARNVPLIPYNLNMAMGKRPSVTLSVRETQIRYEVLTAHGWVWVQGQWQNPSRGITLDKDRTP